MNFTMDSAISVGHQVKFTGCKSHIEMCACDNMHVIEMCPAYPAQSEKHMVRVAK